LKSNLLQELSSNQRIMDHIQFLLMECGFARSAIQVQDLQVHESMLVWECRSNQVRTHKPTLIQKFKLNHKTGDRGHIYIQVRFH